MPDVKTFCPYDHSPDPITCPPGGGTGWRCRALQEDGTCLRLEADGALVKLARAVDDDGTLHCYIREA